MKVNVGQGGEVYFIRERDGREGFSPFVKIGLVRDAERRTSFDRLAEHQTGNPRALHLDRGGIVSTPAVASVEAMLHREFATRRVQGEWFEFGTEADLERALERTRELSAEFEKLIPVLEEAERLKEVPSNGESRESTDADRGWHRDLMMARLQVTHCTDLRRRIKSLLEIAVEEGVPHEGTADTITRTYAPKFQETAFKAAHPELYAQYTVELEPETKGPFRASPLADVELPGWFLDLTNPIGVLLGDFEGAENTLSGDDVIRLNDPYLQLERLLALATWEQDVAEARLKVAVGTDAGITGICTWKREVKLRTAFDGRRFAAEHADLASQFTSDPAVKTYVVPKKTRAGGASAGKAGGARGGASGTKKRPAASKAPKQAKAPKKSPRAGRS